MSEYTDTSNLLAFGLIMVTMFVVYYAIVLLMDYLNSQKSPRKTLEKFYDKKLSKYFSRCQMYSIRGDVRFDSQRYGHRAKYTRRIGNTFTEFSQISTNGKLTSYIFELSCDSVSCCIEFFPNHMRGEALCVADKDKCEKFLHKYGFEKIETLENLRTLRMPPMSFSWHD